MQNSKISGYILFGLVIIMFISLAIFEGVKMHTESPQPEYTISNTMPNPPLTVYKAGNTKFLQICNMSINIETISTMLKTDSGKGTWIYITTGEIHGVNYTTEEIQKAIQE